MSAVETRNFVHSPSVMIAKFTGKSVSISTLEESEEGRNILSTCAQIAHDEWELQLAQRAMIRIAKKICDNIEAFHENEVQGFIQEGEVASSKITRIDSLIATREIRIKQLKEQVSEYFNGEERGGNACKGDSKRP